MNPLRLEFRLGASCGPGEPRSLAIAVGDLILTRLFRFDSGRKDDAVQVPLSPLAFWLADNWWRLRWEARRPGPPPDDWAEAHEVAQIGAGYSWPRITLWGEGPRVGVIGRADPTDAFGPVRYLQDALLFVDATGFEAAVDALLAEAVADAPASDGKALEALVDALASERADPATAQWRRLEAMAGFDPDQAPTPLMERLVAYAGSINPSDVEEAVTAAPGSGTADLLERALESRPEFGATLPALGEAQPPGDTLEPWQAAENAAALLRARLGQGGRAIKNGTLAALLEVDRKVLTRSAGEPPLPYGFRVHASGARHRITLRARRSHDRRFELVRALGDAIWSGASAFGPIASTDTARQKFQRAFAASFLCPPDVLAGLLGRHPTDEDITSAALHFHVSERVVRTTLVNKQMIARDRLRPFAEDELAAAA